MSKFSGKCDFYDHLFMSTNTDKEAFDKFNGTKLFKIKPLHEQVEVNTTEEIHKNWEPIEYHSIRDLVQYYPYTIAMAFCDGQDNHSSTVVLSMCSWVDREEADILGFYRELLLKEYRRCKRKHLEFNVEEAYKKVSFTPRDYVKEMAERIKEQGPKADISDIHIPYSEKMREELKKEIEKYNVEMA